MLCRACLMMCNSAQPHSQTQYCLIHGYVVFATYLTLDLTLAEVVGGLNWYDLSKYTVPTKFVGIVILTKVVGMLMLSALPTKVVNQFSKIQERKGSNIVLSDRGQLSS